jgi:hypothetical protein
MESETWKSQFSNNNINQWSHGYVYKKEEDDAMKNIINVRTLTDVLGTYVRNSNAFFGNYGYTNDYNLKNNDDDKCKKICVKADDNNINVNKHKCEDNKCVCYNTLF